MASDIIQVSLYSPQLRRRALVSSAKPAIETQFQGLPPPPSSQFGPSQNDRARVLFSLLFASFTGHLQVHAERDESLKVFQNDVVLKPHSLEILPLQKAALT